MSKHLYLALSFLFFSVAGYCQPTFTGGHIQNLSACENASTFSINSLLIISDAVSGRPLTWSVVTGPTMGTISAAYTTTSTGSNITPAGTTYAPAAGYTGSDSFTVRITDGTGSDTTIVYVTVKQSPSAITGSTNICIGTMVLLSDAVSSGTWNSSNATVASITTNTGILTAGTAGTAAITYTLNGCTAMTTVTVNALPAGITGATSVCAGHIIPLSDATAGGTWMSDNTTIATINAAGLVTGVASGAVNITYQVTATGCTAAQALTVNPLSPITGSSFLCPTLTTALSTGTAGGTWTSGNPSVAAVFPTTGVALGVAAGTAYITYTLPTGCFSFQLETVNPAAPAISATSICIGASSTLTDAVTGGTWSIDDPTIATIGATSGFVTSVAAGTSAITYTLPSTSCVYSGVFTVNPLPNVYAVSGGGSYCAGTAGSHIYLASSDLLTNYYLQDGGITIGPFAGTGTYFDFGYLTLAGPYTATATDMVTGCTNLMSGSATVTITPSLNPTVSVSSTFGDTMCGGITNNYTATPVYGGTTPAYEWTINGTVVGIDTSYYSYIPGNSDTIVVRLISDTACATPDTVYDTTVMTVIPHQMPAVTISASPGTEVCMPNAVTFTPIPTYGGPSPKYFYTKGGATIGIGSPFATVPSDGDVIYCYMVSDFACRLADTVYGTVTMKVDTPIIPFFSIEAYPPVLTAPGQMDTLTAIVTNTTGLFTYQWIVNDSIIPGATSDTFISNNFTYMGNDSVSCIVEHLGVCQLTSFNWRKMLNNVGIKELTTGGQYAVFPNPGKGLLTIKGASGANADETVSIDMTDMAGRTVYKYTFTARNGIINEAIRPGNLPGGMYLLNLHTPEGNKVFHVVIEQ